MNGTRSRNKNVLISGGGIAGLTLGILLKEKGWEPTVIEREAAMRSVGYVIDFAGAGWDVAERMGILEDLRAITYQVDARRDAVDLTWLALAFGFLAGELRI